jgi:cadmium resistance protein CadD (predicted permease)
VKRDTNYFKWKVILPLVLIVMMSWMVFWIDPSLVASQISVSVTAMLTMIAYRFALAGFVPKLPFLTTLDLFILVSTIAVFMSMMEVLLTAHLATTNQLKKARQIDRHARWIMPLIYAVLATDTLYFRVLF